MKKAKSGIVALFLLAAGTLHGRAQGTNLTGNPPLQEMHQNIDWNYYCNPSHKTQALDHLKCIAAGPAGKLSIGGEVRQRGEYFDYPEWGQYPADNGSSLQRYMLYADLTVDPRLRFFTEFSSSLEYERDGGPRPAVDEEELSLHQAFFDVTLHPGKSQRLVLRAGRQELMFGASRLVGIRDGTNVRQNFDGFNLFWTPSVWRVNTLATKYSESNKGVFSDPPNHAYTFWGVYATRPLFGYSKANFDAYYLGTDKKKSAFQAGVGREQRETLGARVASAPSPTAHVDHDSEAIFQFGTFAGRPIRAWAVSTNSGYTFQAHSDALRTRLGFDGGIASGNHNPTQGNFGTFNALFPNGVYLGQGQLLGPYNFQEARPSLKFTLPRRKLVIWPNAEFLWRQSRQDGVYATPAVLVRASGTGNALFIGTQADLYIEWNPTQHFRYTLDYLHFFPGEFLKQTKPYKDVNFVAPSITYNF
jgi:hypothetical protein